MEHEEEEEDKEAHRIQEDEELRLEMQRVSTNSYQEKVRRRFSAAGSQ